MATTMSSDDADVPSSDLTSCASSVSNRKFSRPDRVRTSTRALAFVSSIISALCAGSITVFSLYGHIFQERLHYTQFQVNGVAIGGAIALYLPVSVLGYVCDRVGTAPLSFLAAILFGGGYGMAAGIYRQSDNVYTNPDDHRQVKDTGWSYPLMILAFVCIGIGTCSMYLSALATCAKNFGTGKHRGLALAAPIASFGLSGMWLSQVGSRWYCEKLGDGSCGDLDVFRFFIFLAALLFVVGIAGIFTLRVVDEEDIIDGAVEELERSGLLETASVHSSHMNRNYSSILSSRQLEEEEDDRDAHPDDEFDDDSRWKKWRKNWVLNAETKQFLSDRTMWYLALGFLLISGPGEAFINNLGTVIGTLNSPSVTRSPTSAATHVSIVGVASTVARLLTGSLTDLFAPSPHTQHAQFATHQPVTLPARVTISRVTFLLAFAVVLSIGLVILASGAVQNHAERFWIVSGTIGAGYGAVFSLTPIIIAIIWGVENFATNWGIVAMFPALGSTVWGLIYSAVYENGADHPSNDGGSTTGEIFCYGMRCYSTTFWAMALTVWAACVFIIYAWKGRGGWTARGIVI